MDEKKPEEIVLNRVRYAQLDGPLGDPNSKPVAPKKKREAMIELDDKTKRVVALIDEDGVRHPLNRAKRREFEAYARRKTKTPPA